MSNKNQNNRPDWAKRVSEYEAVPEDTVYSENETWELIQSRIKDKPAKRRKYIYWAAAALLIIVFVPFAMKKRIDSNSLPTEKVTVKQNGNKKINTQLPITDSLRKNFRPARQKEIVALKSERRWPLQKKINNDGLSLSTSPNRSLQSFKDSIPLTNQQIALERHIDSSTKNKPAEIVHINNINSDAPSPQYDDKKLRRFLRRYDVDAPAKTSAAGSTNSSPLFKNIN